MALGALAPGLIALASPVPTAIVPPTSRPRQRSAPSTLTPCVEHDDPFATPVTRRAEPLIASLASYSLAVPPVRRASMHPLPVRKASLGASMRPDPLTLVPSPRPDETVVTSHGVPFVLAPAPDYARSPPPRPVDGDASPIRASASSRPSKQSSPIVRRRSP